MAKDYYKILGVERKADEKEIKRAYRKLARQHHPDINPNDSGAEARFKEINEAYQVLSDKEKRALYDQFGPDYDKVQAGGYSGGGAGYPPGGAGGVNFEDLFGQARRGRGAAGTAQPGVENLDQEQVGDLFESLFGSIGGMRGRRGTSSGGFDFRQGRQRARGPQKGGDVEQPIKITLAESIHGTQRGLTISFLDQATGSEQRRNVTVKIPAGVREGARVRVARQGGAGIAGGPNGDLYLIIHIEPHSFWKREGDNLHCEVPITFGEAALGAQINVPTINGEVQMKVPAGTQCGQTFRLSGRGVPHPKDGGAGDQFVKVKVTVPKNLGAHEQELIEELSRLREQNVRTGLPRNL
jgi:DnaJ-class molecular chaperone